MLNTAFKHLTWPLFPAVIDGAHSFLQVWNFEPSHRIYPFSWTFDIAMELCRSWEMTGD